MDAENSKKTSGNKNGRTLPEQREGLKLTRRTLLKGAAGASAITAASSLAAPAIAAGTKQLRLVMSWPKGFPGLATAPARFAKRFEDATDGRYKIKIYGGGELVHPLKCLDAVQEGTADLYHSCDYYYQGKSKAFGFFTTVPFGFTPAEHNAWIHWGGGQQLWDELHATYGTKPILCGNTGSQMGGWAKKPLVTVDDFKGLKMRMPGLGGEVLRALGGSPVTLAGAEIMPALQAGTIDATEWVGPWNDLAFGLYKVTKHYHYPGFHEPGTATMIGVSKKLFDGMSKADQTIMEACAVAENNIDLAEYNAHNSKALDTLVNKHGVQLHEFSDDLYKKLGEASKDVLASVAGTDEITKKVYESFMAFRKTTVNWTRYSDQSYMTKRDLVKF